MIVFGRPLSSYRRAPRELLHLLGQLIRAATAIRRPLRYLTAYALQRRLPNGVVRLRNGLEIALSSHPRDVATVFVVFIKRDYGLVPAGGLVIDIGANIGCFSLYAAQAGARRILAFEPSQESFDCLRENVRRNGLADVIVPFLLAVTNGATTHVSFPARSDPGNRIGRGDRASLEVPTTTIDQIVALRVDGEVSLLKMDCEGCEYDIVRSTSPATWRRVNKLRIEYHDGRAAELISTLERSGFALVHHMTRIVGAERHGDLWFERHHLTASA